MKQPIKGSYTTDFGGEATGKRPSPLPLNEDIIITIYEILGGIYKA